MTPQEVVDACKGAIALHIKNGGTLIQNRWGYFLPCEEGEPLTLKDNCGCALSVLLQGKASSEKVSELSSAGRFAIEMILSIKASTTMLLDSFEVSSFTAGFDAGFDAEYTCAHFNNQEWYRAGKELMIWCNSEEFL